MARQDDLFKNPQNKETTAPEAVTPCPALLVSLPAVFLRFQLSHQPFLPHTLAHHGIPHYGH